MASNEAEVILSLRDLLSGKLATIEQKLDNVGRSGQTAGENVSKGFGIGSMVGIATAIAGITTLGSKILSVGQTYENIRIQLKNLTGTAQDAESVFTQIKTDAQVSPFGVEELARANTMMISTGLSTKEARLDILALSNAIAFAGKGNDEFIRMSANMQQIKNIGKATALDIKQFGYAGINIYGALAKATGKSTEEVKNMEVSYELLSFALREAQKEGGAFAGGLTSMMGSTSQKISNLGDQLGVMFDNMFIASKPFIDGIIDGLGTMFTFLQKNAKELGLFALAIAGVATAFILYNLQQKISLGLTGLSTIANIAQAVSLHGLRFVVLSLIPAFSSMWAVATMGIALLIPALIYLYTEFQSFRDFVDGFGASFIKVFKNIYSWIVDNFIKPFKGIFTSLFNGDFKGVVENGIKALFSPFFAILDLLTGRIQEGVGEAFNNAISENYPNLVQLQPKMGGNSGLMPLGQNDFLGDILKKNKNEKTTVKNNFKTEENKKLAKTYESKITNISIGKLVEGLSVTVMETKEIAPKIREEITKYLLTAVNDVNIL
jgi:tape measure domain-containing protein